METTQTDRNSFILLFGVFLVCIIALVALVNSIWQVIGPSVVEFFDQISTFQRVNSTDYNFPIPQANSAALEPAPTPEPPPPTPTPEPDPKPENPEPPKVDVKPQEETLNFFPVASNSLNYNFFVPEIVVEEFQVDFFPDAILDDARLLAMQNPDIPIQNVNISIQIPKANISSPVLQGYNSEELLNQGFWVSPTSFTLGQGEVVMLCHRRHFGPYDPRSCWFLDRVIRGDSLILTVDSEVLRYEVVGVNIFDGEDPLIYSISPDEDLIKIVTCTPLYSNEQRLVVLARRVSS